MRQSLWVSIHPHPSSSQETVREKHGGTSFIATICLSLFTSGSGFEEQEWPALCGMQMFLPCSLRRVIKCGKVLYIRLADEASASDCMVLTCQSCIGGRSTWLWFSQICTRYWLCLLAPAWRISLLSLSFHTLAHAHTDGIPLSRFSNLLKTPVAIHHGLSPSHVNIKGLVSHHDLGNLLHRHPGFRVSPF